MNPKTVLLLNLAILVTSFFLAYGSSDAQIRVMRTTARTAHAVPLALPPPSRPEVPEARLVKYLAKLPAVDRLSGAQVAAVWESLDDCCAVLAQEARRMRRSVLDATALKSLRERMRTEVARSLRAVEIEDEELCSELVRIVLSSTG